MAIKFMEPSYVLFSDTHGVYLGDNHWSMKVHGNRGSAPTYDADTAEQMIVECLRDGHIVCRRVEVYPDLPNNGTRKCLASIEACANALLPRWPSEV